MARIAALVIVAGTVVASAPGGPSLEQVIERLGRYVADCGERMSVIVGVEHYDQRVTGTPAQRSLVSEIAFIPTGGDWLAYRDVFQVDNRRIADRTDRLQRALVDSPQTAFEQARRIADESARYNLGDIQRNFNTPTMCLFVMRRQHLSRFKFKKAGEEDVGGIVLWRIRFEEKDRPTVVRSPNGRSLPMKGVLWLRPGDGAVFRTEMEIEGTIDRPADEGRQRLQRVPIYASVSVEYERDARLETVLPVRMREVYRGAAAGGAESPGASGIEAVATYSDFKRFETSTRLVIPK